MSLFPNFSKNLAKTLMEQGFHLGDLLGGGGELSEETGLAVFLKAEPPVLYIFVIINEARVKAANYDTAFADYLKKMEAQLPDYSCSHILSANLFCADTLSEHTQAFLDTKEPLPGAVSDGIWWQVSKEGLYLPKKQPKNLLRLRQWCEDALTSPVTKETMETLCQKSRPKGDPFLHPARHKLTLYLIAVNVVIFCTLVVTGLLEPFLLAFGNHPVQILQHHEYYRLLTSVFLHIDWLHLGYNSLSLYIFGSLVEEELGRRNYLALYLASGIVGSLFSILFTKSLSAGASGAIFGLVGILLAKTQTSKRRIGGFSTMTLLMMTLCLFLSGAVLGGVDQFAHLGGFLTGFVCIFLLEKFHQKKSG